MQGSSGSSRTSSPRQTVNQAHWARSRAGDRNVRSRSRQARQEVSWVIPIGVVPHAICMGTIVHSSPSSYTVTHLDWNSLVLWDSFIPGQEVELVVR